MAELKTRLRQAMEEKAIRQVDICEALNIPKSALSQYLSGKSNKMDTDRLHSLAMYLGKSEAWLMGYEDAKNVSAEEDRLLYYYNQLDPTQKESILTVIKSMIRS